MKWKRAALAIVLINIVVAFPLPVAMLVIHLVADLFPPVPPSDGEMIDVFRKNESRFAALAAEMHAPGFPFVVNSWSGSYPDTENASELRRLLDGIGLDQAKVYSDRYIYITYDIGADWSKSFAWRPDEPSGEHVVEDMDSYVLIHCWVHRSCEAWRPLSGHWYIHFQKTASAP